MYCTYTIIYISPDHVLLRVDPYEHWVVTPLLLSMHCEFREIGGSHYLTFQVVSLEGLEHMTQLDTAPILFVLSLGSSFHFVSYRSWGLAQIAKTIARIVAHCF